LAETCPLCRHRRAKRSCPGKGFHICSTCCGEKRRVEIDCPDDCVYLQGSHAPSWEGRETERKRDLKRLAPHVGVLKEDEAQLFFATLVGIDEIRRRRPELDDPAVATALGTVQQTLKTRGTGLIYDHPAEGILPQLVVNDLLAFWGRLSGKEPLETKGLPRVLEALAHAASAEGGGTGFLETTTRLVRRHGLTLKAPEKAPQIVIP
jgi:hypothetical protein